MNREQLISDYIDQILDNMSTKDLMRIVGDQLEENFSSYTDDELLAEVEEYYPELLSNWLCTTLSGLKLKILLVRSLTFPKCGMKKTMMNSPGMPF